MTYYIGVDIGTTSTKTIAFSQEGKIIALENISYEIYHPHKNQSEQKPDEILKAVIDGITSVTGRLINDEPVFISFSAAMHSILAVNEKCEPLTDCIIWADNRAGDIAKTLLQISEGRAFYETTGVPVHAMSPLCKLLWLKEHAQNIFTSAFKFIGIKEYIFYHFTKGYFIDTSLASATGLLNLSTLLWDEKILGYIGIDKNRLSTIVEPSSIYYISEQNLSGEALKLKYLQNLPLIIGASDGGLANLGSGAVSEDTIAVSIGTSCAIRIITPGIYIDAHMRTFCYHLKERLYVTGGAGNNGAIVLQWLRETVLKTSDSFESLFSEAEKIAPGCDGLLCIPYILGERSPVWNADVRGMFFGMDIQHQQAHFVRAAMEGIIYNLYAIGQVLLQRNEIIAIRATGGFTHSRLWLQILSDVFNTRVEIPGTAESAALGAIAMGMEALGISYNWNAEITDVYHPDSTRHEIYKEKYSQFEKIYQLLSPAIGS